MSEYTEVAECIKRFRGEVKGYQGWPEHSASLRPSMNGIKANNRKFGAIMWNMMKAMGSDDGDPDLAILIPRYPHFGLLIEHKAEGSAHKLTEAQREQLEYFEGLGYCAVSTRGTEALWAAIVAYMQS